MTRLLLLLLVLALPAPAIAQSCSRALDRAESSYRTGDFDATISRLTTCIDRNAFNAEQRRQAYRLIGLSYIGKDRESDAREAVARLLDVAPNYEPDPALDPPPFVRMVADVRRSRPRSAGAARPLATSRGLSIDLRGHYLGYSDSDDDTLNGGGGDLTLGYALSPALTLYAQLGGSTASADSGLDLTLGSLSLGARYHIGSGRLVPYVGAAGVAQSAEFSVTGQGSADYTGVGGEVEGGVLFFLSPSLAAIAGATATVTSLSTDLRADDITATTVRIGGGLSWRP